MEIKELAKFSNSRMVNNKPRVSSKKCLEIQQLSRQHGYSSNVMVHKLSSPKNFSIGALLASLEYPYYAEVLAGIARSLSKSACNASYAVHVGNTSSSSNQHGISQAKRTLGELAANETAIGLGIRRSTKMVNKSRSNSENSK